MALNDGHKSQPASKGEVERHAALVNIAVEHSEPLGLLLELMNWVVTIVDNGSPPQINRFNLVFTDFSSLPIIISALDTIQVASRPLVAVLGTREQIAAVGLSTPLDIHFVSVPIDIVTVEAIVVAAG